MSSRAAAIRHAGISAPVQIRLLRLRQHATGWNDRYNGFIVTKSVRAALNPGRNVIAVHTHQDTGGQFIDLAVLLSGK
ncbi:MAG: hypothetical protein NTU88_12475 [Armatimonadetes bacterium]|nr:hypothetical protein [Armatimonadota bacterium]